MISINQSILPILNLKHCSTCENRSSASYRRSRSALDSQIQIGKRFARWPAEPSTASLQFCCAQQQGVPDQLQPQITSSTHHQSCNSLWEAAARNAHSTPKIGLQVDQPTQHRASTVNRHGALMSIKSRGTQTQEFEFVYPE